MVVKTATVIGKSDHIMDLERKLARQLVKDLDVALTPEGEARLDQRQANGVDNIEDVARFSNAIDLSDRGDYANAAIKMAPLVSKYPNSHDREAHRRRDLPARDHRQQAEGHAEGQ